MRQCLWHAFAAHAAHLSVDRQAVVPPSAAPSADLMAASKLLHAEAGASVVAREVRSRPCQAVDAVRCIVGNSRQTTTSLELFRDWRAC